MNYKWEFSKFEMEININKYEKPLIIKKVSRFYKKKIKNVLKYTENVFPTKKYSYWYDPDSKCLIGSTVIGRYLIDNIT